MSDKKELEKILEDKVFIRIHGKVKLVLKGLIRILNLVM